MIIDYALGALVTLGFSSTSSTRSSAPSGSEDFDMTINGWIQIALYSAIIIAITSAARRLHDARLHRRADLPLAGPAAVERVFYTLAASTRKRISTG